MNDLTRRRERLREIRRNSERPEWSYNHDLMLQYNNYLSGYDTPPQGWGSMEVERSYRSQERLHRPRPLWSHNPYNSQMYERYLNGHPEPEYGWERDNVSPVNWPTEEIMILKSYRSMIKNYWAERSINTKCRNLTITADDCIITITSVSNQTANTAVKMFETYSKWKVLGIQLTTSKKNLCPKEGLTCYTLKLKCDNKVYQHINNMLHYTCFVEIKTFNIIGNNTTNTNTLTSDCRIHTPRCIA